MYRRAQTEHANTVAVADTEPRFVDAGSGSFTVENFIIEQSATVSGEPSADAEDVSDDEHGEYLSDLSSSDDEDYYDIRSFLRFWTQKHNVKQNAVSDLLKGLRDYGMANLPSDCRTLMRTPKNRNIVSVPPGQYSHIGLKKALDCYMNTCKVNIDKLTLDFNIDGVPISRSSTSAFWLILVHIGAVNCTRKMFVIGVFHGYNKPANFTEFLKPFIDETLSLQHSYQHNDMDIELTIRCIICDAPARNSCLGTKGYNGYFGCGRCTQIGEHKNYRMTFPEITFTKRTDEGFRSKSQPEHHHYDSPFLVFDIDIIGQFPLDYLHTVCLGVVKKLVGMWLGGDLRARLKSTDIQQISDRLIAIALTQPSEFQRKCRSLKEFSNFKGTEFRNLIVYILPVATHGILPNDKYQHMLILHVAMLILIDPNLAKTHADVAQELLEHFVKSFSAIYGAHHVVYNVHSLLHIVDDVKKFGCLDNYSAFPFESYMSHIKRMLKNHKHSLAQVCNRVEESYQFDKMVIRKPRKIEYKKAHEIRIDNVLTLVHKEIVFPDFVLNCKERNQWFLTDDKKIFQFHYANRDENTLFARKIKSTSVFFDLPISSQHFDCFVSDGSLSDVISVNIDKVTKKIFAMTMKNRIVFSPLRHSN